MLNETPELLANAQIIYAVGKEVGATDRDIVIAYMTAYQESYMLNLAYGDLDSLGLFQQRADWGTAADREDPAKSTRMFFLGGALPGTTGLLSIANRDQMTMGQACQAVQHSAYPERYQQWQTDCEALFTETEANMPLNDGDKTWITGEVTRIVKLFTLGEETYFRQLVDDIGNYAASASEALEKQDFATVNQHIGAIQSSVIALTAAEKAV